MVAESNISFGASNAPARNEALLLSFRAFNLAIAAALQSSLPLGEWFRCALIHAAGNAPQAGEDGPGAAGRTSDTLSGELALRPEDNTVSDNDRSKDLLKQAGSALEVAQNRINGLCDALQGLINLSDSKRVTDFGEVKRSLARAKEVLLESRQVGHWHRSRHPNRCQQNQGSEAA